MATPRTTLEQWRAFQAVVDCGGFAQAAGFLARSQSSVSYAVAKLQQQLGVPMLIVQGRKARLTEAGQALLSRARYLLNDAAALENFAATLEQGWEAEIQLVVDAAFPAQLLMEVLQVFKPLSRGSRVQLTQVVMSGADDALEEGWADLVIGGHVPPRFLGDLLLEIEFIAVAHPDHPLHRLQRELTRTDLESELQVVISDSGARHKRESGLLPAEHRWTVTSIDNAAEAICAGLGFCWLPRHKIQPLIDQRRLLPLPLREGRSFREHLYLILGRDQTPGPATRLLADQFQQIVRDFRG